MMKRYWVYVLIQNEEDPRAWLCGSSESYTSIEKAKQIVQRYRENHVVLCAWIREEQNTLHKRPVFFECYTNILGMVNNAYVGKTLR